MADYRHSHLRRLACRIRGGHDDAVAGAFTHIGAALLACGRCGRCLVVPYRATAPPPAATKSDIVQALRELEVAMVDQHALDRLMWDAKIGAHLAARLWDGDDTQ